jgi:hypothetical protein
MLARAASTLAAFAALFLTARADASTSARLVYVRDQTAAACPDEDALRQAVKQRVGYDPFFPWAKTTIVVEMSGEGDSFVARVRLVDERGLSLGARDLHAGTNGCQGLVDAAALAISIGLDTSGLGTSATPTAPVTATPTEPASPTATPTEPASVSPTEGAPASPTPAATPTPTESPAPTANPDRVASVPASSARAHGSVGLDAVAAIASAPAVAPGVDAWAEVRLGVGSLGVDVRVDAPNSVARAAGGTASILFTAATVAPCLHAGPFFACALGSLGWLHASGADLNLPRSGSALAPSVGPRVGIEVPLGRSLALRVRGDLLINTVRPVVLLDQEPAWTLPRVSGVLAAGLAYRFP